MATAGLPIDGCGYLCYVTGDHLGPPRSPDLHVTIEDLLLADRPFASRTTVTGTQQSHRHAPTRRHISVEAVDIGHLPDSRPHQRSGGLNMYGELTQLDGAPALL